MSRLTQCPSCGGNVDSQAPMCPHCGKPTPAHLPVGLWIVLGALFLAVIIFMLAR